MHKNVFRKVSTALMAAALAVNCTAISPIFTSAADAVKYEFEDAVITGDITVEKDSSASGGSSLKMTESGSITLKFSVENTGTYNLIIYAGGIGGSKQQNMSLNGTSLGSLNIPESTGYEAITVQGVKLTKGENTLVISKSWGWTNFDYLQVEEAVLPEIKAKDTTPVDKLATKETKNLMSYLASVYGKNIISGQQEIYQYGPHDLEYEFEYLKDLTGHYPAIRGFDFGNRCCELFGANDDGSTSRIIEWVKNKGGIATASFHLNVPKDFKNYTGGTLDFNSTTYAAKINDQPATDFVTANAYKEGTKEYDYYRKALKVLADDFKKLEAEGIPVIWRPLHEAEGGGGENQSWFWWGKEGSAVYKQLWIYTYETLTNDFGCHNLIWEWNSYNFDTSANWYPGDEYVDIIGYDKYNCTEYLQENNWKPSLVHNTSSIASTFYGIMQRYNGTKMVSMAENDSFSTVQNLQEDKAGWLYFCTWYDGGSDNINFLTNPIFNTKEDTIAMYQSDYCITLDELPADLYSKEGGEPEQIVYGDANCNGEVKMNDAVLIMQVVANADVYGAGGTDENAITEKGMKNADCYDPGSGLTSMDALSVQKYLIKSLSSLPEYPIK
jgi:mannan endo-1,4-beta-mannosidase